MGEIPINFESTVVRPQMAIPEHMPGFPGTEEDSLGSFLYLVPKVPKKNFDRMMEYSNKVFRFMARLESDLVQDSDRVFVVKYFLAGGIGRQARAAPRRRRRAPHAPHDPHALLSPPLARAYRRCDLR